MRENLLWLQEPHSLILLFLPSKQSFHNFLTFKKMENALLQKSVNLPCTSLLIVNRQKKRKEKLSANETYLIPYTYASFLFFKWYQTLERKTRWECVWSPEGPNCCWGVKDDLCPIDSIHHPVLRVMASIADVNANFSYNELLIKD